MVYYARLSSVSCRQEERRCMIMRRRSDMQSLRKRFGGLYWRLTGSYLLVTLLAAVIIDVAITLPASLQEYQQGNITVHPSPSGFSPPSPPTPSGVSLFLSIFWNHLQGDARGCGRTGGREARR